MKQTIIKRQIMIPTVALAVICGFFVLMVSILLYRDRVVDYTYDKVDFAKLQLDHIFVAVKERERVAINGLLESEDFIDSFAAGNEEELTELLKSTTSRDGINYGVITDTEGTVIAHALTDDRIYRDNISHLEQIQLALGGETTSAFVGRDDAELRIATSAPIYDASENIIGTITLGQILNHRPYTLSLRSVVDCEITFFDGSNAISSTLNFPSLTYVEEYHEAAIIREVLEMGHIYHDTLHFLDDGMISGVYPLYGIGDDIAGMLFIGIPTDAIASDTFSFAIRGLVIYVLCIGFSIFVSIYNGRSVMKKLDEMNVHMTKRDKLFEAVNSASIILLEIDEADDIRIPLISCMEHIGNALNVDHVHLWRSQQNEDGATQFVREYSWVSDYGKRKTRTPKYITATNDKTQLDWMDKFLQNEHISGIVSEMHESYQGLLKPLDTKSIAMIPLFLEDQFWGMFTIDDIQFEREFSDDEINILHSISLMMANIVRRHELQNENLKVYFDALTGINNRRYFDKTMVRVISSLSRAGSELGVLMIDVDYFKRYNDTYGHGAGDECLVRVAELLAQSATRVDDFVARYGGEEFVVVMPNTDKDGAIAVATRMLENIRAAAIPHKASDVCDIVTVSIGVTTGRVTQHHTAENFVKSADDMLYKSKEEGRNRLTYGELK